MMATATARLLSRPNDSHLSVFLQRHPPSCSNFNGSLRVQCWNNNPAEGTSTTAECVKKRKPMVVAKAVSAVASERVITGEHGVKRLLEELGSALGSVSDTAFTILTVAAKRKPGKLDIQMLFEKGLMDCRFFTLLAVAGSLLGSVLCFVEGCFLVLETYVAYFQMMLQGTDPGQVVQLLIEALDMFLVGTAMLTFGASLHVMFVGLKTSSQRGLLSGSNLFGLYHLKRIPAWVAEMRSVSQAKSRVGHAVMMMLQVGVLEKFKIVPVATGLDLACFAGAVLLSSACILLLSKLSSRSSSDQEHA